jgi:NAD dependent epimerase/dehydratase family enzyme
MSWIHRDDLVRLIVHLIATDSARGPINATAPLPVRNRDFAATLGRALHRPAVLPLPGRFLRLLLGQMADEILLSGQKVLPDKAWKTGFRFDFPDLAGALEEIVGQTRTHNAREQRWSAAAPSG